MNKIKMKTSVLLFALSAICGWNALTYCQTSNYLWAKSAGGNSSDVVHDCTTDASGNIIVTGFFWSSSITFGTTTLTNADSSYTDMFIVKYDANGNVLWAKSVGGNFNVVGMSCTTDASGNIIVTGSFAYSSITFGKDTLTNANSGYYDMFIVKYDANGNVLWAKSAGGNNSDVGYACTTDASGNIIATGSFESYSITFGTTTLTNADSVNGYNNMFIVKYDSNGKVLWAKNAGGTYNEGVGCTIDAGGNIIATGYFRSSSITFGTTTLTNADSSFSDMFIVKYDANGNVLWAKNAGGNFNAMGLSCTTDASGNIIATGSFESYYITFGTTTLINADSVNSYDDMFIVKYDSNGNVIWAKSTGGTKSDRGTSCSTDANGNIIATGTFRSSSINFGTTTLTNADIDRNMFIVKYDANGNVLWAKSAGGTFSEGVSCTIDVSDNIIVTGFFATSSITFGTTILTNASYSYYDMFVVKLSNGAAGIEEPGNNVENLFTVGSNPNDGKFNVQCSMLNVQYSLVVCNMLGEKIYHSTIQHSSIGSFPIDLSNQPNGIYFLLLQANQGIISKKLIIQR